MRECFELLVCVFPALDCSEILLKVIIVTYFSQTRESAFEMIILGCGHAIYCIGETVALDSLELLNGGLERLVVRMR